MQVWVKSFFGLGNDQVREHSPNLWWVFSGQVVNVLAFDSYNPSSNPAKVYNISVKLLLNRTETNKKRPGWPIKTFYGFRDFNQVQSHFLLKTISRAEDRLTFENNSQPFFEWIDNDWADFNQIPLFILFRNKCWL